MLTKWNTERTKKEAADKRRERTAPATPFGPPIASGHGCGYGPGYSSPQLPPHMQLQNIRTSQMEQELDTRKLFERAKMNQRGVSYTPLPSRNSSPVEGNLADYVNWIKKMRPEYAADFRIAKNVLMGVGYTTEVIQLWKDDTTKWKELLPNEVGIGLQLSRNVGKWGRSIGHESGSRLISNLPQRFSPRKPISEARSTIALSTYKPGSIMPSIEQPIGQEEDTEDVWYGDADSDDLDGTQDE